MDNKILSCTILVNSCDKYSDVWPLFFKAMEDNWKDFSYRVVLNTESLTFNHHGMNVESFSFYPDGQEVPWGERLKKTLEQIDSEYIVFVMDDFILEAKVDQKKVEQCIQWMNEDKSISAFYFLNIEGKNIENQLYEGFELLPQRKDYRLNSAPAVWRREKLIQFTGDQDSPWCWEFFGSARTYRTNDKFYCLKEGELEVYKYNYILGGAIHRGKWVKSVVEPLIAKYSIDIDLNIRGVEDEIGAKTLKRSSLKNRVVFFCEGFKLIGFDAFIFVYRSLKKTILRRI